MHNLTRYSSNNFPTYGSFLCVAPVKSNYYVYAAKTVYTSCFKDNHLPIVYLFICFYVNCLLQRELGTARVTSIQKYPQLLSNVDICPSTGPVCRRQNLVKPKLINESQISL
jgi:hypothetical protein